MSGDCGHGWGYHSQGPSGPCDKCVEEEAKANSHRACLLAIKNKCTPEEWEAISKTFAEQDAIIKRLYARLRQP